VLVFTKIDVSAPPFHKMAEAGVKLLPVTVSVNRGCPAWMLAGEIPENRRRGITDRLLAPRQKSGEKHYEQKREPDFSPQITHPWFTALKFAALMQW